MAEMLFDLLLKAGSCLNPCINFFCDLLKRLPIIGLQDNNKFIAAKSAHNAFSNAHIPKYCGHLLQNQIADIMSVCIIIMFKIIQIDEHQTNVQAFRPIF